MVSLALVVKSMILRPVPVGARVLSLSCVKARKSVLLARPGHGVWITDRTTNVLETDTAFMVEMECVQKSVDPLELHTALPSKNELTLLGSIEMGLVNLVPAGKLISIKSP